MKKHLVHIKGSPMTTVLGLLLLLMELANRVKWDALGHLAMTPKDWFGIACAFCVSCITAIMPDGDKQVATDNTTGKLEDVDAHKEPDQPGSTPVTTPRDGQ